MAKQAHKIAQSINPAVGASTLASLEGRTTSEAAQSSAGAGTLKTGLKFTGQYLYDRFVANDKTEVTKLSIVREMTGMEVAGFKAVLADFVKVAKGYMDNAEKASKAAPDDVALSATFRDLSAKYKTAQNHQNVMRNAYGALRFAPDELTANGYTEQTGYQVMRTISIAALKAKGIKWDGTAIPTNEVAAIRKVAAAETKALAEVMADTPRNDGESLKDYVVRMDDAVQARIKANQAERQAEQIKTLVARFRKEAGGLLDDVIQALMTADEEAPVLTVEGSAPLAAEAVKH